MSTSMLLVLSTAATFVACAGPTSSSSPRTNSNVITHAEILEAGSTNAFRLIQAIRTNWLIRRGQAATYDDSDVVVYLDGTRIGYSEELRNLSTDDIESMEYLPRRRADNRFGQGHTYGAILVTTKKLPPPAPRLGYDGVGVSEYSSHL